MNSDYKVNISSVIDFNSEETETLGISENLIPYYSNVEPGYDCLQGRTVILTAKGKNHIKNDHNEGRIEWILQYFDYIALALSNPDIIYQHLEFKTDINSWSQAFAVKVLDSAYYMVVVITLARADEGEDACNHIITIMKGSTRYFFKQQGKGVLKEKWKKVR